MPTKVSNYVGFDGRIWRPDSLLNLMLKTPSTYPPPPLNWSLCVVVVPDIVQLNAFRAELGTNSGAIGTAHYESSRRWSL